MSGATPQPTPVEIGRANQHDIRVQWSDGTETVYVARQLRLKCPCAMCVDENTGLRILKEPGIPLDVHPVKIEPPKLGIADSTTAASL